MSADIRFATPSDFLALAYFIEVYNQPSTAQCIQTGTGENAENLLVELEKLHAAGEIIFALALENDQLIGVIGCEFAEGEGRGWVRGPLIAIPAQSGSQTFDFQDLAGALYHALATALPPAIHIFDTFLNVENLRGQAFYERQGYGLRSRHHVYVAARPDQVKPPQLVCFPMEPGQLNAVMTLHNRVFPGSRTGQDVLKELDDDHRVWVYALDGEVQGYVFAVIEAWAEGGYVEFLGVREDARGRGVGGALLVTALHWCFAERGMPEMGLTVEDGNVNARGMYERAGFRLKYSGVNQRFERK